MNPIKFSNVDGFVKVELINPEKGVVGSSIFINPDKISYFGTGINSEKWVIILDHQSGPVVGVTLKNKENGDELSHSLIKAIRG